MVVQETETGGVSVSAVDPVASMAAVENPALAETAAQVRTLLREAVEAI